MIVHRCCDCGSENVRRVKVQPRGPLPDPWSGVTMPRGHLHMPITELVSELQEITTPKRAAYALVLEVYARAWPGAITDWEVLRTLEDWLEPDKPFQRTDIAPRSTFLRDHGWTRWTGERVIDPETGHPNQTARLTRRGAIRLGLQRPRSRRRVVRRPRN